MMEAPPHLVAFTGHMGAGKDTAAAALVERGYTPMSFAAPLKSTVCALFGLTDEHVNGKLKDRHLPEWGTTPRRLMQVIGTDVVRNRLHEHVPSVTPDDFWVQRFRQEYAKHRAAGDKPVVVTDVRFPNEAAAIRELGGVVYRVSRSWGTLSTADGSAAHASETAVDSLLVDGDIRNDGTVAELHAKVLRLVDSRLESGEPHDTLPLLVRSPQHSCIIPAIPVDKCRRFKVPLTGPVNLFYYASCHPGSSAPCSFPWVVPARNVGPGAYRATLSRSVDAISKARVHLPPHEHVTGMRLLVNNNVVWRTSHATKGAIRFFLTHDVCMLYPMDEFALEVDTNGTAANGINVELTAVILPERQRGQLCKKLHA